jgi:hypothetical protein
MSGGSQSGLIVWGYGTSGRFPVYTASGDWVTISGTITAASAGISSALYNISSVAQTLISLSGAVTVPTYLSYAMLHLSSNMTISSEFAVYHNGSLGGGGYSTKIYSVNMSGHTDAVYTPDSRFTLFSGDAISTFFTNSGSLTVAMRMVLSTTP